MNKKPISDETVNRLTYQNAAIYARFSSHNQREESIEQQVAECENYAFANHLNVVEVYADSAKTGKTDKRTQYQRLQRDAKKGKFQYIIAYKSNRIARNMFIALTFEADMEKHGIKVVYAKEEFGDTAAGRFALRTMMNVNQFYSENMSEDIKRGMRDNAEAGIVNGSLPYGYVRGEDGKPKIDEPRAAIVREIFEKIANGTPFIEISNSLNARGIKTKSGKPWGRSSYYRIMTNVRYTGVYMHSGIRIENGMPQIVSKELYLKVQDHLKNKKNPQGRHTENGDYLLSGKLKCGHCNSYMMGMSGTGRSGKLYYYYVCQEAQNKKCDKRNVRREHIEYEIAHAIRDYILQDDIITWITDVVIKYQKEANNTSELSLLQTDLKESEKSIKNILNAIESGIITESTKSRLIELENEKQDIENKIALIKANQTQLTREQIHAWLMSFKTGNIENKSYRKLLFNTFLKEAYLYDDDTCKIVFDAGIGDKSLKISLNSTDFQNMEPYAECSFNVRSAPPLQRRFLIVVVFLCKTDSPCVADARGIFRIQQFTSAYSAGTMITTFSSASIHSTSAPSSSEIKRTGV